MLIAVDPAVDPREADSSRPADALVVVAGARSFCVLPSPPGGVYQVLDLSFWFKVGF